MARARASAGCWPADGISPARLACVILRLIRRGELRAGHRGDVAMATQASSGSGRHPFFLRMAFWLSLFIVFGFLQFAARGFVDYRAVPVWFHLHGMAMTTWLGLTCVQAWLANSGTIALHRRLGW